jgi:serine/threonine-protein kinase
MESPTARPVEGTEGGHTPFFSPDGQWLGFFAGGLLKKVSVNGGAPIALAEAAQPGGATWSSKGVIVFEPAPGPLHQVSDSGGEKRTLTRLADGETTHFLPTFLPDADTVLFNAGPPTRLAVYSLSTGERRDLLPDDEAVQPRHISTGHVVYGAAGTLMAVPFDSERLQLAGTAVPVVEDVRRSKFNGILQFSISSTGTLAYVSGGAAANQSRLVWVDRRGTAQRLVAPVRGYRNPKISPNGLRVALGIDDLGSQTWVYDLARETLTRLTFEGRNNDNPIWTPNGQRIAFSSDRDGVSNVFWQPSDGSGEMEPLTTSGSAQLPLAFSPDGQTLAFRYAPRTNNDIWMLRMSDRDVQPFFESPSLEVVAEFSPDGHWLAYVSDETGRWEVFVRPYPGPGGKRQVSTEGGTEPVWNRNGRELFFRSADKMMVVQVTTQGGFSAATPRVLFEGPYRLSPGTLANYDVAPDGERFLMVEPVGQADSAATQINVVQNWLEELKRLVPVD